MLKNSFKNRVNYLIRYSLSKTSKENYLIENLYTTTTTTDNPNGFDVEDIDYNVVASDANPIEIEIKPKCLQPNVQPTECFTQSPQNLITPPLRPDGNCGSIKGFCYRKVHNNSGIFVPSNSKLYFWSADEMLKFTEQIYEHYKSYNVVVPEKNEIFKQMISLIGPSPEKTLMQFKFTSFPEVNKEEIDIPKENYGGFNIVARIENLNLEFLGFADKNTREYYISPKWKDNRTPYQKFVDEWVTVIQMSVAFATAILAIFSEGTTLVLTLEILTELGLGAMVAQREWEKGENVSAVFSLIFAGIPFLKTGKWLRSGISSETYKSISKKLLESKLTSKSDIKQYKSFYNKLTPPEKKAWTLIMEQDAYTRQSLIRDIKKALLDKKIQDANKMFNDIAKLMKTKPNLAIKNIEWWKKLWAREVSAYSITMVLAFVYNSLYPEKSLKNIVSEEEQNKLEGIVVDMDEKLRRNLEYNLAENIDEISNILKTKSYQKLVESSVSKTASGFKTTETYKKIQQDSIKKAFDEANLSYKEVVPTSIDVIPTIKVSRVDLDNLYEKVNYLDTTQSSDIVRLEIDGTEDNENFWVKKSKSN